MEQSPRHVNGSPLHHNDEDMPHEEEILDHGDNLIVDIIKEKQAQIKGLQDDISKEKFMVSFLKQENNT